MVRLCGWETLRAGSENTRGRLIEIWSRLHSAACTARFHQVTYLKIVPTIYVYNEFKIPMKWNYIPTCSGGGQHHHFGSWRWTCLMMGVAATATCCNVVWLYTVFLTVFRLIEYVVSVSKILLPEGHIRLSIWRTVLVSVIGILSACYNWGPYPTVHPIRAFTVIQLYLDILAANR